jgi:DNA-binding CsgD family transcriptional regulator
MDRSTLHTTGVAANGQSPPAASPADTWRLTKRQQEVLALMVEEATYAQIALALTISVRTAEKHAEAIFRELGVSSKRAVAGLDLPNRESR